ncbi:hypothetical protein MUS1_03875 [Marinomonas ushuaiensis DSM 15871]|uniref:Uncharacterized protein n=1 Tax=Marinomonas ushuaiensis DSM 15871 TaxID=1122207 RepID=X7E2K7_9GAMM|nr:DUF6172 family protein [Marinomonas ushuaiensis]ETX10197.1 hypothetical protein MUS1_03875 [Marinomonas ushuaiensis DSM 15871]
MKKTFELSHPKIAYPRLIEATKNEVKKYLKRERNKALPEYADFWGFDCKFGQSEEAAEVIHVAQINEKISFAESQEWSAFYLEILATPAQRTKRSVSDSEDDFDGDDDVEIDHIESEDE